MPLLNKELLFFVQQVLEQEKNEDTRLSFREFAKKMEEQRVRKHYWDELSLGYTPNLTQTKRDFDIGKRYIHANFQLK